MKSARATIALRFLLAVLASGFSSAGAQTYVSLGYGGVSCATWTSRKAIEGNCKEHAQANFDAVVRLLIDEHAKKNSALTR